MNIILIEFVAGDNRFLWRLDHIVGIEGMENCIIHTFTNYDIVTSMNRDEVFKAIQDALTAASKTASGIVLPKPGSTFGSFGANN